MSDKVSVDKYIRELLSDTRLLHNAWNRVLEWYKSGELTPMDEYARWQYSPAHEVDRLSKLLTKSKYAIHKSYPIVPYPKKGGMIRHYCMPSVDDQVVFVAYVLLLGPLLESVMPTFSFGNRWFQSVFQKIYKNESKSDTVKWENRPFSLNDKHLYQPYRRAYGLYRRVAHWTTTAIFNKQNNDSLLGDKFTNESYPESSLPDYINEGFWRDDTTGNIRRAYWAQLDIQLAYPSVRIDTLRKRMINCLTKANADNFSNTMHYPVNIINKLRNEEVVKGLAHELCDLLEAVTYEVDVAEQDIWKPEHTTQRILPEGNGEKHPGLPTGLTISGLLLNVYLSPLDEKMNNMIQNENGPKIAFMRFADDMLILAKRPEDLLDCIDMVWRGLCDDDQAVISNPFKDNDSNLRLSIEKLEPESLKELFKNYLKEYGWKENDHCCCIEPSGDAKGSKTLSEYYHGLLESDDVKILSQIKRDAIRYDRLDHFVTNLVKKMSDIAKDSLVNRFGDSAESHLGELHQLIRYNIDDKQVKPDTRLSFAANQLARAWLPEKNDTSDSNELQNIRESVRKAVIDAPWKMKLWRQVIMVAVRRTLSNESGLEKASEWFESMLEYIRVGGEWSQEWTCSFNSYDECNPVCSYSNKKCECEKKNSRAEAYLTGLRVYFWDSLTRIILELSRVIKPGKPKYRFQWSSRQWVFRALSEDSFDSAYQFITNISKWKEVLYKGDEDYQYHHLEKLAIKKAILACTSPDDLYRNMPFHLINNDEYLIKNLTGVSVSEPDSELRVSKEDIAAYCPRPSDDVLRYLAYLFMNDGKFLGPDKMSNNIRDISGLRLSRYIEDTELDHYQNHALYLIQQLISKRNRGNYINLQVYHKLRKLLLTNDVCNAPEHTADKPMTIYHLLWGNFHGKTENDTSMRDIMPTEAPVIGLPVRVALKMLKDAVNSRQSSSSIFPLWILEESALNVLTSMRRIQYGSNEELVDTGGIESKLIRVEWLSKSKLKNGNAGGGVWLHPLFLLLLPRGEQKKEEYRLLCNILTFIVTVTGSEWLLDQLFIHGTGVIPFDEKWTWRHSIHLKSDIWEHVESLCKYLLGYQETSPCVGAIKGVINNYVKEDALPRNDYNWERVDIQLDREEPNDLPVKVLSYGKHNEDGIELDIKHLRTDIHVRLGQLSTKLDLAKFLETFPDLPRSHIQKIMKEVRLTVLFDDTPLERQDSDTQNSVPKTIIVLPEWAIPNNEERTLENLASEYGIAILAGFAPRELPSVSNHALKPKRHHYIVNEAKLFIPLRKRLKDELPKVRKFTIRKPLPTHVENAFAKRMSSLSGSAWTWLPGIKWYRFIHKDWGDFSVAICADIIDPVPWANLRGKILHLFSCAYNTDVNLFESMTWVRAYENYVNVALVNTGVYGGSFAWTPKHNKQREVIKLRGNNVLLVADIHLPVKELYEKQKNGVAEAIDNICNKLKKPDKQRNKKSESNFKSPPPMFRGRE